MEDTRARAALGRVGSWFHKPTAFLLPFLCALCALCGSTASAFAAPARPPNIVLVMTDDQGWFELGVNGNHVIETPNMDRLAADGVRFTHFYACPVCTP